MNAAFIHAKFKSRLGMSVVALVSVKKITTEITHKEMG